MECMLEGNIISYAKYYLLFKAPFVSCHREYSYTLWKLVVTAALLMVFSITYTLCKRAKLGA